MGARAEYGNFFQFYNFFGLGNNTTKDDALHDDNFYKARYKGYTAGLFAERVFFQRSLVRLGGGYEQYATSFARNTYLGQLEQDPTAADLRPNTGFQRLAGLSALFYKFSYLGLRENLRGYVRNRFTGDASLYLNSELRLALGQVQNNFLPFSYGVFGFFDRGRVYYDGRSPGGWHDGYGAGFYLAPVTEQLALAVSYQLSDEETGLIQFGLGF
jgi:hemolysin activation/secretion protein